MRVVIADDALLIREGVSRLLEEAGHVVVAAVPDVPSLLREVQLTLPDAAVVDIRMPPSFTVEGLDAARSIARIRPGTGVLVLSQYLESGYAVELLTHAPSHVGYLLKDHLAAGTVLVDALTRVASGECLVDPAVVERLVTHPRAEGPLAPLSAREVEVLSMVAQGLANTTIADRLDVSRRTLEWHVRQIFIKLGIAESPDGDRRVLAVLTYLRATTTAAT